MKQQFVCETILHKAGYVSFAADVYGKGKRASRFEECFALMKPFRDDRPQLLRLRLLAALNHVKAYDFVDQNKVCKQKMHEIVFIGFADCHYWLLLWRPLCLGHGENQSAGSGGGGE